MKVSVLTLFPEMFLGPLSQSILKRAQEKKLLELDIVQIRDFANDKHKSVDDRPYGGGQGMVMRVDILHKAIQSIHDKPYKILLDPRGRVLTQAHARILSKKKHLLFICGHYEGVDERVQDYVDESLSIGSYVLTGGELPAMVAIDTIVRLVPGVLGNLNSPVEESFGQTETYKEHPQYTRPPEYRNKRVPTVLLSGDHARIQTWKKNH